MGLRYEAVSPKLLNRLRQLMAAPELKDFYLVGGTALALHYGHRFSVDVDLFSSGPFNVTEISTCLTEKFQAKEIATARNSVSGVVDSIKLDLMTHAYPLIAEVQVIDGIRLLSPEDLGAMKLNAIANRGSKKDFWDYCELLKHFDREALLAFFEKKYPGGSSWAIEKSLCYFDDAESEPDPISLSNVTWEQVRSKIEASSRVP